MCSSQQIRISTGLFDSLQIGVNTLYDFQQKTYSKNMYKSFTSTDKSIHGEVSTYVSDSMYFSISYDHFIISSITLDSGFTGIFNDTTQFEIGKNKLMDFISPEINFKTKPYF